MVDGHTGTLARDAVEPGSEFAFRLSRVEADLERLEYEEQDRREDAIREGARAEGWAAHTRLVGRSMVLLVAIGFLVYRLLHPLQDDSDD